MNSLYKILVLLLCCVAVNMQAQKAWVEPDPALPGFNPEEEIKIFVDLAATDNENMIIEAAESGEDMYIWTWNPWEHTDPDHPLVNGLGAEPWKESNDALIMTPEYDLVYSYTMVPTEFYEVEAKLVFENGISFLVKPKDGGGYGDPDIKSEDINIEIPVPNEKVYSIPPVVLNDSTFTNQNEIFTIFYNNKLEEKATMLNVDELYLYARAEDMEGNEYRPSPLSQVGQNPLLKMSDDGNGLFYRTMVPYEFFDVPDGVELSFMRFQIIKKVVANTDDTVDGEYKYIFNCN